MPSGDRKEPQFARTTTANGVETLSNSDQTVQ